MSIWSAVVSFALVAGLLTIIPGLDTALVLRAVVANGRKHAFVTALGINTGALVWGAAAAAGVSALLAASTLAYAVVRVVGAAYMVLLGCRIAGRALRRDSATPPGGPDAEAGTGPSLWRSWSRGLLTNLLNPKIGAFYVAVLPQFIPPDSPHIAVGLLLALVHDVEGMLWFTALILGAGRLRTLLAGRRARRSLDVATGSLLVAFGVRLGLTAGR